MWNQGIHYERLELLGEGGQGRVFKALRKDRATGLSETVALKILHSETAVELWKKEFESLRRVRSPYCVQVLSFDRVQRRPALILEFVDGVSLLQLGRSCVLDCEDVKEISAQIEAALEDLNRFGAVHGDLSPANVLVGRDGRIKLLDFGLANTSGVHARLTPEFASPERLAGGVPTIQDDLFSLRRIESFLLGRTHGSSRDKSGILPDPRAQEILARKVSEYLKRKQWTQRFKTRTQQVLFKPVRRFQRALGLSLTGLALITASSAATNKESPLAATLLVRTLKWHRFTVNGRDAGYSPLNIVIPAREIIQLGWKNARGTGHRQLILDPGQHLLLEDRDLLRGSHAAAGGTPSHFRNLSGRTDERRSR